MLINGREIALSIYSELQNKVTDLKKRRITPHLVVILVGNNPASLSYIKQKKQYCESVGALFSMINYPSDTETATIIDSIKHLNADPKTHGIIVQRPLPPHIEINKITKAIDPEKDIDGFRDDSDFDVPVALAVIKILETIQKQDNSNNYQEWLKLKKIAVIGRGSTAGAPIIKYLAKLGINAAVISSKTENPADIISGSDIIISAVGKPEVIKPDMIKKGSILIGVGLHTNNEGKLRGDYYPSQIKEKCLFYTPATGGVGPVNVAYLISNLITAASNA